MSFMRPCGRYKEVESDVEMEMKLIKGLGELNAYLFNTQPFQSTSGDYTLQHEELNPLVLF